MAGAFAIAMTASNARTAEVGRTPEGDWHGSIMGRLRIGLHVERAPDGSLRATFDSPDQGAMGLPLDSLVFANDSLHFRLRVAGGRYAARLNAAGDSLLGIWRQSGGVVPLWLTRGEHAAAKRSQVVVPPYPYDTVAVSYDNPRSLRVRLAGTLTLPRGKGPFPAALLISGSGSQDRDETLLGHRPFRVLADHLTRQGIAVLRVDDRGVGGSTGSPLQATSEDFAGDVLAGVEFLTRRRGISRRHIGLIGHSEGGLIAPLVTERSKDVAFIVLLAGPGMRGDSLALLQMTAARRALGVADSLLVRERGIARQMLSAVAQHDSARVARLARELVQAQPSAVSPAQAAAAGGLESLVEAAVRQVWNPWMRFFLAHDPAPPLRRVRCPVLALNGERDVQVLATENLAGIEQALRAGRNRDYTVKVLPGLNHLFQTCHTGALSEYPLLEETFAPSALALVSDWIRQRTGLAK